VQLASCTGRGQNVYVRCACVITTSPHIPIHTFVATLTTVLGHDVTVFKSRRVLLTYDHLLQR
jgi:hypothetical protein